MSFVGEASRTFGRQVDVANGEIDRAIFSDPDLHKRELENIFGRCWLYVGHESQIPSVGDFFLSRMGDESVILTRDQKGEIRVHLNTCRHRGMRVCRYDEGNTRQFYCPYHAWTYGLDGKLIGVQEYRSSYQPPFNKEDWGLIQVAQIAVLRGTIWATWSADAPSFEEYLGDAYEALDLALRPWDGGEGQSEVLGTVQKWIIPSNWKIVAENFSGDMLHGVSHRSVDVVGIGPKAGGGRRDEVPKVALTAFPEGHGILYGILPPDPDRAEYSGSEATAAYFRKTWERRLANLGEKAGITPVLGTIFPNASFHSQQPRTILVAHPRGADKTEMWRIYLVDKDAPPEVREFLRRYYIRYSGPAGMTEQDDMENWLYATESCRGTIARRSPFNYKSGLEAGGSHPDIPGHVTEEPVTTEQNPRALYNRWAEFMESDAWPSTSGKAA